MRRTGIKYREINKGEWMIEEFEKEEKYCMKCFVTF